MSEEALQIVEERSKVKARGKWKERYTQLNAELLRIVRRDKKAFLNEKSEEIEEKSRMGKTEDLFKKIGDIKGIFHSRMGTIKDRGSKDQQKQKRFRRSGKNTQKTNTKKDPNDPDNHKGVVTLLELNILECEVRWAIGSITTNKASGVLSRSVMSNSL